MSAQDQQRPVWWLPTIPTSGRGAMKAVEQMSAPDGDPGFRTRRGKIATIERSAHALAP